MNAEAPLPSDNILMQRPTANAFGTGRASPRDAISGESSAGSNGIGTCNNADFEDQVRFNSDDEKKELASLSVTDAINVQNDLYGMVTDMTSLGLQAKDLASVTTQQPAHGGPISESLSKTASNTATHCYDSTTTILHLENEISTLPTFNTAAYRQAQQRCPDQLSDERKMVFVEYEDGNIANAARKLVKYWAERVDAFGPERAFLPMTLAGAMQDEVMHWIQRPIWQVLPVADVAGRTILFAQTSLRDFSQYTPEHEVRSFMYAMETLMEDVNKRRKGFIILHDGRNLETKNFDKALSSKLASLAEKVYPIDCRAVHICHPSEVFNSAVMPVIKALITKDQRLRLKSHIGTTESVLRDLEGYCLSKESIPVTLGGDVTPDLSKWILDRIQEENSRLSLRLFGMTSGSVAASGYAVHDLPTMFAPAPAKRPRNDADGQCQQQIQFPGVQQPLQFPIQLAHLSGMSQHQQLPSQFANAAFSAGARAPSPGSGVSSNKKAGKSGRRRGPPRGKYVDPRMTMAVKTKMANPNLPLQDALEAGGFVFTKDPNSNGMIDLDGTSLVQRKNNLCRRLRLEKEEQIARPPAPVDSVTSTTAAIPTNFGLPMPPLPAQFQGASFVTGMAPQMQIGPALPSISDMGMASLANLQDFFKFPAAPANNNNNFNC